MLSLIFLLFILCFVLFMVASLYISMTCTSYIITYYKVGCKHPLSDDIVLALFSAILGCIG